MKFRLPQYQLQSDTNNKTKQTCLLPFLISERAGEEGRNQLLQEIDFMRQIGSHRNVLSMLGYWVKSEPIMLILEYVPYGDLLQWLRSKRQQV